MALVVKNQATAIASRDPMVNRAGEWNTRLPGHGTSSNGSDAQGCEWVDTYISVIYYSLDGHETEDSVRDFGVA